MDTTISMTGSELELLRAILQDRLGDLRQQTYHAEAPAFKDSLKSQQRELEHLISKLPS